MQHAQERNNAIERDNADDVRRADRDRTETIQSQQVARRALETLAEQKRRLVAELASTLALVRGRSLPPRLHAAAKEGIEVCRLSCRPEELEQMDMDFVEEASSGQTNESLQERLAIVNDFSHLFKQLQVSRENMVQELKESALDADMINPLIDQLSGKKGSPTRQPQSSLRQSLPPAPTISNHQSPRALGVESPVAMDDTDRALNDIVSYLIDQGCDPTIAIACSRQLVSCGLVSIALLQECEAGILSSCGIPIDVVHRIHS